MKTNEPQTPAASTPGTPAASATAALRGLIVLFGDVVESMPPEKMTALADAITAGAKVTASVVLPLGAAIPDVTFSLLLPDARSIEIAAINIGKGASHAPAV